MESNFSLYFNGKLGYDALNTVCVYTCIIFGILITSHGKPKYWNKKTNNKIK